MPSRELWRWVVGYEGLYMVSNKGGIQAVPHGSRDGQALKAMETNNGYLVVRLFKDGAYHQELVHRLVAMAFVPNPSRKPQVNHKDGNRKNNSCENLEWATCQENIRHKYDVLGYSQKGRKNYWGRRFTDDEVRAIRKDKRKPSVICLDYGCSRQCIADIKKKKYYKEVKDD